MAWRKPFYSSFRGNGRRSAHCEGAPAQRKARGAQRQRAKGIVQPAAFLRLGGSGGQIAGVGGVFNLRRTHHALGGLLVPADRYFGRSDVVLAQIESGAAAEGIGEPIAVGERMLDVVRVTSRAGKVELWMMGQ